MRTMTGSSIDSRRTAQLRPRSHGRPADARKSMAANVETMAIVVALTDPPPSLPMLDRLIAFAVQHDVEAALILTKASTGNEAAARGYGRCTRRSTFRCWSFSRRPAPGSTRSRPTSLERPPRAVGRQLGRGEEQYLPGPRRRHGHGRRPLALRPRPADDDLSSGSFRRRDRLPGRQPGNRRVRPRSDARRPSCPELFSRRCCEPAMTRCRFDDEAAIWPGAGSAPSARRSPRAASPPAGTRATGSSPPRRAFPAGRVF